MSVPADFLVDGKWTCTACGACCKSVGAIIHKGFPKIWVNKKGGCKNQTTKGKCGIYHSRPPICRVEHTLMPHFDDLEIAQMCSEMKNHMDAH